jgi:hypothetical protein
MSSIAASSSMRPASQSLGRVGKDRAADGEALDHRTRQTSTAKATSSSASGASSPSSTTPRHQGSLRSMTALDPPPQRRPGLRLELPPVGLDAERVEFFQQRADRVVVERPVLAGDDLDQQLAADLARGLEQPCAASAAARPSAPRRNRRDDRSTGTLMQWSTGHSTSCEPMSCENSKRSGREPGSSTGRPSQERDGGRIEHRERDHSRLVEQHAEAVAAGGDLRPRLSQPAP